MLTFNMKWLRLFLLFLGSPREANRYTVKIKPIVSCRMTIIPHDHQVSIAKMEGVKVLMSVLSKLGSLCAMLNDDRRRSNVSKETQGEVLCGFPSVHHLCSSPVVYLKLR